MNMKIFQASVLGLLLTALLTIGFSACSGDKPKTKETTKRAQTQKKRVQIPAFSGDSAYFFVQKQLEFGFRVPGTPSHKATQSWLVDKLKSYGTEVKLQAFKAKIYTGDVWDAANIIASINPDKKDRIIIAAHYDTRFIAEKDPDKTKRNDPIMGADDGASGVAVILEIVRLIHENPIDLGIDFILFDAEDNGNGEENDTNSWCLGAQHWSKQAVRTRHTAKFGILLDLVGAKGAIFPKEYYSQRFAPEMHNKIWNLAISMGYGDLFENRVRGSVNDDHYHVSTITGIPMIDIIGLPKLDGEGSFGDYHHTHKDNIDIIDKNVLRKTGQVVTAVLYKMSTGNF